jgi:hypothetical protein
MLGFEFGFAKYIYMYIVYVGIRCESLGVKTYADTYIYMCDIMYMYILTIELFGKQFFFTCMSCNTHALVPNPCMKI